MRKIVVTEDNFQDMLERMQKISNKYKMFLFYQVFTEDMKEDKQYRNFSIGFRWHWKYNDEKETARRVLKFFCNSKFIYVTKHRFREKFEQGIEDYGTKLYNDMKSLIHIDMAASQAEVLSEGDKIRFLPFNLGFVIYTDNDYTRFNNPLSIYRKTFISNIFSGKIKNLDGEISLRNDEWEDDERLYNQMEMESLEYDDPYECMEEDWLKNNLSDEDSFSGEGDW